MDDPKVNVKRHSCAICNYEINDVFIVTERSGMICRECVQTMTTMLAKAMRDSDTIPKLRRVNETVECVPDISG